MEEQSAATILVVDDDRLTRLTLQEILETVGYRVATARNGTEALEYLRDNPNLGLVLLDLVMPETSGWRFLLSWQDDAALNHIPVVVVSGVCDPAAAAGLAGAAGYLAKPLKPELLIATVQKHCPLKTPVPAAS